MFVMLGGCVFEDSRDSYWTIYDPLQADLFLYLYEVNFMQRFLGINERNLARIFISRSAI